MKTHHIEPKTHEVYHFDKFGRKSSQWLTHREYDRSLPDILELGHTMGIQYYVSAGGESRALDYYNVYRGSSN